MGVDRLTNWLEANRDGLMTGAIVGAVLVALMLVLRAYGERTVRRDPLGAGWRSAVAAWRVVGLPIAKRTLGWAR